MSTKRVVIAGASLGGLRTAEYLRSSGFTGEVLVVGDEKHAPYNRPPLSKDGLRPDLHHDAVALPHRLSHGDVQWRLGSPVVSADLAGRRVRTANGDDISFDALVVATGLRPRRLPVLASVGGGHVLRTLEDAKRLAAAIRSDTRVVVVGAGFIGCEIAAVARSRGAAVTVLGLEAVPLEAAVGKVLGGEVQRRHLAQGVNFRMGVGIARAERRGSAAELTLTDGSTVVADVVVEAVGSVPNVEWLAGNELDLSDGVLTDAALRVVSTEHVFAVGDVARHPNAMLPGPALRYEHWSTPVETARCAARGVAAQMAEVPSTAGDFCFLPSFWSDQYDWRVQSYGAPRAGLEDVRLLGGALGDEPVLGYHARGDLVGLAGIGSGVRTFRAELLTSLTRANQLVSS